MIFIIVNAHLVVGQLRVSVTVASSAWRLKPMYVYTQGVSETYDVLFGGQGCDGTRYVVRVALRTEFGFLLFSLLDRKYFVRPDEWISGDGARVSCMRIFYGLISTFSTVEPRLPRR